MKKEDRGKELTARQKVFVDEYLIDLNATRAAKAAGYNDKTAGKIGWENLGKPHIAAAVQKAMAERAKRVKIKADDVLREILLIMQSDVRNYTVDESQELIVKPGVDNAAGRAVSSFRRRVKYQLNEEGVPTKVVETEIKLWSKPTAIEHAAKHLGMLTNKVEHSNNTDNPVQVVILPDNGRGTKT